MGILSRDNGIRIGRTAYTDPVLAQASLEAATMVKNSVRLAPSQRFAYIMSCVRARGPGLERGARTKMNDMVRRGVPYDQAVFDAVRMTLADRAIDSGIAFIQRTLSQPNQAAAGLGSAKDVGCAITGGITAVGSFIAGIFGGGGGAAAVGTGGGTLAESIGCNDAARAAASRDAATMAQAARDELETARVQAEASRIAAQAQVQAEFLKGKRYTTLAMFGGGVILVLGLGYLVMKV